MYAALNGETKVCKERVTFPGNKVYFCPFCGTSSLGPPIPTCRCGAVFSEEGPILPLSGFDSAMIVEASLPDTTTSLSAPLVEMYEEEGGSQGARYAHPPVRIDEQYKAGPQDAPPLPKPRKKGRKGGRR